MVRCSECDKEFILACGHMYKRVKKGKTTYQCSYSCYRKAGGDDGQFSKSKLLKPDPYLQKMRSKAEE